MKIKVLHVLHSLRVGGLENGLVNLINRLDPERFEHAICCIDSSGPMAQRITRPVRIVALDKGAARDYLLPLKLARVIRGLGPDLVHTRNWGSIDAVVAARLAGVRRVVHGEHGREASDPTGANLRRNKVRRALSPLVSRFVAVSEDLREWLVDEVGISGDKVGRILNGVNTERFAPGAERALLRERLGVGPGNFLIGTVGRLDPVKDQASLLRAFAALPRPGGARLCLVGSGPEEAALQRLSASLGLTTEQVSFLGERSDIPELMQALDLFVLPSIAEGISNTVLEAMACGLPVAASRVGGNGELVLEGETGALFAPGDVAGLSAILERYRAEPRLAAEHGQRGRRRAELDFSLERMVRDYQELYLSVCRGAGR